METEKVYTDLSPAQREAQTQPATITHLQTFYPKQDKDMTAQYVFGSMVEIATPILEAYHSDLFWDAMELNKRNWKKTQTFFYCVGNCGTNIVDKLSEARTLQHYGRERVYMFRYLSHKTLKGCFQLAIEEVTGTPGLLP